MSRLDPVNADTKDEDKIPPGVNKAGDLTCHKCGKPEHFRINCPRKGGQPGRRNGKKEDLAKDRKGEKQQTCLSLLWSFETALLLRHNDPDLHSRAETDASGFQIMHWKGAEIYHVFTNHHTLQGFVKQPPS
ncbi:hypothetical protein V8E54_006965 [Elaphomyces granulatus]